MLRVQTKVNLITKRVIIIFNVQFRTSKHYEIYNYGWENSEYF